MLFLRIHILKDYEKYILNFKNHLVMIVDNNLRGMLVLNSQIGYGDRMTNQG